jgi:PAS domain S-box-containing protein
VGFIKAIRMNIEKRQLFYLAATMIAVAIFGISISLYVAHKAAFEAKRLELKNIVQSRARVMESVARFDQIQSSNYAGGSFEATLSQFKKAHEGFEGFGATGEFTLAKQEDDQIVFLLRHRHSTATQTQTQTSILINSTFAESMRRALKGESGVIVGLDYRGEKVLAAYEPVAVLNLGLVAKIDLSEIRAPFIKAGIMAGGGGLIAILLGLVVFFRISEPLIKSIKDLQGRYERAIKGSKDGLWDWPDISKDEQWWSDDWYGLLGLKNDEIKAGYSNFKSLLHPDDLPRMEEALKQHFYGQDIYDVEYRLKHKSGEYLWFRGRGAVQRDNKGNDLRMSGSISDIHQSKQDREAIDRLSQVAQQVPISVLITDHEGNIEFVNEALQELSGYSLEEVLGQNPRIFKSGESPDSYYKVMWETIAQGKEWRGVFHNKRKNGELYWESVLIFPLKDINGKVSNFIGLKEDITEKKQLESTLIDHERLIRSVVNNLKDGLIISSTDGNIQLFNKGAEEIFGYKAEEVMDKPVEVLMDESNKAKHDIGFARFNRAKKISPHNASMEVVAQKKDGTPVPIELTLTQMEQRGELLAIGLVRDISERKEAERKHQESEGRFRTMFEENPLGVAVIESLTGKILSVNPRFAEIVGRDDGELLTLDWMHITHPDDVQEDLDNMKLVNSGETEGFNMIKRYFLPDNSIVWVSLTVHKMPTTDKDCPIHLCMVEDITERKEAETKMVSAQKQLMAAQKLAGVGELAAGVSHEVLNPVNIISVHTQMLQRKTKDDANIQKFCDKIKHEIERIQKIMSSLLAFSRKGEVETETGSLRGHIENVLGLVEEEYKLDNIKIVRDWCDTLVDISFDSDKIRQVYLNLIHNAKHAMPDGGTITVGCRGVKGANKNFHQFTFTDTGAGMSEETRLKIFEPFFTTKPEGEGTGMGLSVIHGIIEEHGGKIRVESEEGKGTTFIISLPIAI